MNYKELLEKVISREITLDQNGHDIWGGWGDKFYIEGIKTYRNHFNDKKQKDPSYKDYDEIVPVKTDENNYITSVNLETIKCKSCNKLLRWHYVEKENKLLARELVIDDSKSLFDGKYSLGSFDECVFKYKPKLTSKFKIQDTLIFKNFIREALQELDKEEGRYHDYSLESYIGMQNITNFYSKLNLGWGQMTNTSVHIFVPENKDEIDEILIYHCCHELDEDGYENDGEIKGYKRIGEISCDMWCWMCGDLTALKELNHDIATDLFYNSPMDYVEIKNVKKGVWELEHYFVTDDFDEKTCLASKLKLIE